MKQNNGIITVVGELETKLANISSSSLSFFHENHARTRNKTVRVAKPLCPIFPP